MKPRVSIGMPVRNAEQFLEITLESILAQTFTNFELVVSDNASTDETDRICRRFAERDSRIRYCRNPENLGAADNYNRVFKLAVGEYFKWAAHDDVCHPEFIASCVDILDSAASVVLCYSKVKLIDRNGSLLRMVAETSTSSDLRPDIRLGRVLFAPACNAVFGLIRSAALRRTSLIGRYRGSDQVLLAELSLAGRFYVIPRYLFCRRDHPGASLRANRTHSAVATWFDPGLKGGVFLPSWRLCIEYARVTARARISPLARLRCYRQIARWMNRQRMPLARQLYHAGRDMTQKEVVGGQSLGCAESTCG